MVFDWQPFAAQGACPRSSDGGIFCHHVLFCKQQLSCTCADQRLNQPWWICFSVWKTKKSTAIFPTAHVCVKSLALEKNQHWCRHVLEYWLMYTDVEYPSVFTPRNDNTIASCPIQALWHLPHSHWLGTRSGTPMEPACGLVIFLLGSESKMIQNGYKV